MADNTTLNPGTGGDLVRTIDRGGIKTQVMALDLGGEAGPESLVSGGALPVAPMTLPPGAATDAAVLAVAAALAAPAQAPLSPNAATELTQQAMLSALSALTNGGAVRVLLDEAATLDNPAYMVLTGSADGAYAGVPIIEQVLDPATGEALSVRVVNQPRQDSTGAAIISDAVQVPGAPFTLGATGTVCIIDTQGYGSISVTLAGVWVGTVSFFSSNDLQALTAVTGSVETSPGSISATATAVGTYAFSTRGGRYFIIKLAWTSGQLVAIPVLRSAPYQSVNNTNINFVGGATLPTVGAAVTTTPLPMGGATPGGLTTRIETDSNGAIVAAGGLPIGYLFGQYNATFTRYTAVLSSLTAAQSTINPVTVGAGDAQGFARMLRTTDAGRLEVGLDAPSGAAGESVPGLLFMIYNAIRVGNFYLSEICRSQAGGTDEPDALLAELAAGSPS